MAKEANNLYTRTMNTELIFGTSYNPNNIIVKRAVIVNRNFSGNDIKGRTNDGHSFTEKGRKFRLVLTPDQAQALMNMGKWNLKPWQIDQENPDLVLYTLKVIVNMNSTYPPKAFLLDTFNGVTNKTQLSSDTINILDSVDIERADLIINPYEHQDGEFSAYLDTIKVVKMAMPSDDLDDIEKEFQRRESGDEL